MFRFLSMCLLAAVLPACQGFKDILTHSTAGPVEVIDVSIESGIPDAVSTRRSAEQRRGEAASLAALARRRSIATGKLEAMVSAEKLHQAQMADILG